MEALKAEIALKRKAFEPNGSRPSKYIRKGDIERLKEEDERKERLENEERQKQEQSKKDPLFRPSPVSSSRVCPIPPTSRII